MSALANVLTIAGSDSSGGAGVQQDLATIFALGAHAFTAVTAITAQDSQAVRHVHVLPPEVVARQIDAVASDAPVDAVKTGMLASEPVVDAVAAALARHRFPNVVVDPVLMATSGAALLDEGGARALMRLLLPLARVVTPNAREAELLSGVERVRSRDGQRAAARAIFDRYGCAAVVTGGHVEGEPVDLVYDGDEATELRGDRVGDAETHGGGCQFSAALAVGLARGASLVEAAEAAKRTVARGIANARPVGRGLPFVRATPEP